MTLILQNKLQNYNLKWWMECRKSERDGYDVISCRLRLPDFETLSGSGSPALSLSSVYITNISNQKSLIQH